MVEERGLITGANGGLGKSLHRARPWFAAYSKYDLDITDKKRVMEVLVKERPDAVYNCAAATNMDECEAKPSNCWNVNARGAINLLEACEKLGIKLVHVSTDYAVEPINEYGWSKLAADELIQTYGIVFRASLYGEKNYVIRTLLNTQDDVFAYFDNKSNPISYPSFVKQMLEISAFPAFGVHDLGTSVPVSRFEFARMACRVFRKDATRIVKTSFLESKNLVAPRKQFTFLQPEEELGLLDDLTYFKKSLEAIE